MLERDIRRIHELYWPERQDLTGPAEQPKLADMFSELDIRKQTAPGVRVAVVLVAARTHAVEQQCGAGLRPAARPLRPQAWH